MIIRIKNNHFNSIEAIFIVLWTFYSVFYILFSLSELTYLFETDIVAIVGNITLIFQFLAFIFVGKYPIKKIAQYGILVSIVFLIELSITDRTFLVNIFFIILAQQIDFDKLIRYDIKLKSILTVVIIGMSLTGIINNYTAVINGNYKQALGFTHPNTFTCMLITILIEYLYIRFNKMKWYEWIGVLIVWGITMQIGGGRTSGYTFLLLLLLFAGATYFSKLFYSKLSRFCFTIITPLMAVFSFVAVWLYRQGDAFMVRLNSIVTNRLSSASSFIGTYGIKLFGQEVEFISSRRSQMEGIPSAILDNSYVRCAVYYGLFFLLFFIVMYSILLWRAVKTNKIELALVGLFFAILGFAESYTLNVVFNITFLYLLGVKTDIKTNSCGDTLRAQEL